MVVKADPHDAFADSQTKFANTLQPIRKKNLSSFSVENPSNGLNKHCSSQIEKLFSIYRSNAIRTLANAIFRKGGGEAMCGGSERFSQRLSHFMFHYRRTGVPRLGWMANCL